MLGASLLSPTGVFRIATITLIIFTCLVVATFIMGTEIKGARRWIGLGSISIQPSEFLKPAFAVFAAWLFASARTGQNMNGNFISIDTFSALISLLLLQPDVGMSVVISAVWATQFS